jgi:hypothetical protein
MDGKRAGDLLGAIKSILEGEELIHEAEQASASPASASGEKEGQAS